MWTNLAVQATGCAQQSGIMSFAFLALGSQLITGVLVFVLFHLGGVGVREHNPFAAAIILVYYAVDFLASAFLLFANSPGIGVLRIIITARLLSNLRATWIACGWKPESEEPALPPRFGETFVDKLADIWPAFILAEGEGAVLHLLLRIPRAHGSRAHHHRTARWPSLIEGTVRSRGLLPDAECAEDEVQDVVSGGRSRD